MHVVDLGFLVKNLIIYYEIFYSHYMPTCSNKLLMIYNYSYYYLPWWIIVQETCVHLIDEAFHWSMLTGQCTCTCIKFSITWWYVFESKYTTNLWYKIGRDEQEINKTVKIGEFHIKNFFCIHIRWRLKQQISF